MQKIKEITSVTYSNTALIGGGSDDLAIHVVTCMHTDDTTGEYVIGRDVHSVLQSRRLYSDWMPYRIQQIGLIEGEEYVIADQYLATQICVARYSTIHHGGHNAVIHLLPVHVAKELALMEGTDRGRFVRRYFINLERLASEKQMKQAVDNTISNEAQSWCWYFDIDSTDMDYTCDAYKKYETIQLKYYDKKYPNFTYTEVKRMHSASHVTK